MYDKLKNESPIELGSGINLDELSFERNNLIYERKADRGVYTGIYAAKYKGLTIEYMPKLEGSTSGRLIIKGSIHKYSNWDGNRWNDSDFYLSQCIRAIEELSEVVKSDLKKAELRSLEFGVNLRGFDTMQVIESLQTRRNQKPHPMYDRATKAYGKRFKYDQFELKLYDKVEDMKRGGIKIPDNSIFRIEYRATKMRPLNKIGVRTVGDALDKDNFIAMGNKLAKTYGEINKVGTPVGIDITERELLALFSTLDLHPSIKTIYERVISKSTSMDYMKRKGREVSKRVLDPGVHEQIERGIIETVELLANH